MFLWSIRGRVQSKSLVFLVYQPVVVMCRSAMRTDKEMWQTQIALVHAELCSKTHWTGSGLYYTAEEFIFSSRNFDEHCDSDWFIENLSGSDDDVRLPRNYFFTSGLNSQTGYCADRYLEQYIFNDERGLKETGKSGVTE